MNKKPQVKEMDKSSVTKNSGQQKETQTSTLEQVLSISCYGTNGPVRVTNGARRVDATSRNRRDIAMAVRIWSCRSLWLDHPSQLKGQLLLVKKNFDYGMSYIELQMSTKLEKKLVPTLSAGL